VFGFRIEGLQPSDELPTEKLLVGDGFKSLSEDKGGSSVIYRDDNDLSMVDDAADGQDVIYRFRQITDKNVFEKTVSASAAASFGWGIFSGDANYQMFESGFYSSFRSYLYVYVLVLDKTRQLKIRKLTDPAKRAAKKGYQAFYEFAGDEYIYGFRTGGEFTAIVEYSSRSSEEHSSANAAIDAACGLFAEGEAHYSEAISKLRDLHQTDCRIHRIGGLEVLPTIEGIAAAARNFPTSVRQHPRVRALLVTDYRNVEDFPTTLIDYTLLRNQQKTLGAIAGYLNDAYAVRNDLLYLTRNRSQFKYSGDLNDAIQVAWSKNEELIRQLLAQSEAARNDPRYPVPPPPQNYSVGAAWGGGSQNTDPDTSGPTQRAIVVRAYIDGKSDLVFMNNFVSWFNEEGDVPGKWAGSNQPTIIDGAAWYPNGWTALRDAATCQAFGPVVPGIPRRNCSVSVSKTQTTRANVGVLNEPTKDNNFTTRIQIWDSQEGADWAEITISWVAR